MTWWPRYAAEAIDNRGALQNVTELSALLAILEGEVPEHVLEIGTWAGGLTWALMQLPEVKTVVTVDMGLRPGPLTDETMGTKGVYYIQGDSTKAATIALVKEQTPPDGFDVLVIDGGHDSKTVRADWGNYAPLVASRGLVVMHDTQGYPGIAIVEVPEFWASVRTKYRSLELVEKPGGPGGTGIIWKG